jgi:putative spermidine/putrescine transport system substrate-binding protein
MSKEILPSTSRRRTLKAAAAGITALAAPAIWTSAKAQSKRIVVRDDGGIYTKAYSAVYYKPFTAKTGIEVVGVQAAAEPTAQIKSMVDTKAYTWTWRRSACRPSTS